MDLNAVYHNYYNLADLIEVNYPDELFEHESSKEGKEEVYRGYRKLRTAKRLLSTRLSRESE